MIQIATDIIDPKATERLKKLERALKGAFKAMDNFHETLKNVVSELPIDKP